MVVKMMRWRPWPPLMSSNKKFEVKLIVRKIEGVVVVVNNNNKSSDGGGGGGGLLMVEIRWKGPKVALSSLRRRSVKNFTKEEQVSVDGVVEWNEEFQSLSNLSVYKDNNVFHPWEISFTLFNVLNQGSKKKVSVVGTALLNLAEYASVPEQKEFEINVPLILSGSSCVEPHPSLCLSLNLLELRTANETPETVQRSISSPVPSSPLSGEALSSEKDELSALKAGLRKVKIFKEYVSTRRSKKACREGEDSEGRFSSRSEDAEYTYPFDTESPDDFNEEEELEENKDYATDRKSFSYGTLAHANCAGGLYYSEMRVNGDYEDWVYYSNRKSDVGCLPVVDTTTSITDQSLTQSSKRSILSWRKRKLSFRSPKAKGEPLLKKSYGEEGGDDIDFDRRQLNSDESLALGWREDGSTTNRSSISEFGDDNFAIGSWEHKELVSRDGHMKLFTQVFFASIDQRSERAAGESACTALVAVIADWFQTNQDLMPIKSQFDSLIRDGSLEWRNLCENETYMERFPDKHFDLETVLQAKIRSLTVSSPKSFIGFFHPGGMDDGGLDFLDGAMSFDSIWDEISRTGSDCHSNGSPQVYIVSWNDHFFVLKVEPEAYYIIDTLGERLYEGCNQAYILKFDRETAIHSVFNEARSSEAKPANGDKQQSVRATASSDGSEITEAKEEEVVVCKGKESCKEYIKSFLAAIPIRELQVDIKKGLSTSVHSRLQIEFHYTEYLKPPPEPQAAEAEIAPAATQVMLAAEVVAC